MNVRRSACTPGLPGVDGGWVSAWLAEQGGGDGADGQGGGGAGTWPQPARKSRNMVQPGRSRRKPEARVGRSIASKGGCTVGSDDEFARALAGEAGRRLVALRA